MKIAFTSCMDAMRVPQQPIWTCIRDKNPDVLMLLGDQIYMDWGDLGVSNWKRDIEQKPADYLKLYAEEMHLRYRAQALQPEFLALITHMRDKARPVILCWDDHDFAWNNSLGGEVQASALTGQAAQDWDRHGVPKEVKAIALSSFTQFKAFVDAPGPIYPDRPNTSAVDPMPDKTGTFFGAPDQLGTTEENAVPFLLLDTRWFRTPRSMPGSTMLGRAQSVALAAAVAKSEGLLIVAGGTPLKHKYLFGDEDWVGDPGDVGDTYPEYEELIAHARRPVLYLSGDIHRNAWGGALPRGTTPSPVLQMLASPAAIARIGPKRFDPSFGLVDVNAKADGTGTVTCEFWQIKRGSAPATLENTPGCGTHALRYAKADWLEPYGGEASGPDQWLAPGQVDDITELAVLSSLARTGTERFRDPISIQLEDMASIDAVFEEQGLRAGLPEPLTATAFPGPGGRSGTIKLAREGGIVHGDLFPSLIEQLIARAFVTAKARGTSVVFFIHGVGKSPAQAIDQGYGLRALYGCEPVVFCWPAGRASGGLRSFRAPFDAKVAIPKLTGMLWETLKMFTACARQANDVPSVILARSAGATLLHQTIGEVDGAYLVAGVDRIVLSSPAIEASDFVNRRSNAFLMDVIPQTVVTVNQSDQTLRNARWITKPGPALGLEVPPLGHRTMPRVTYLDFKNAGVLHDYLLVELGQQQREINKAMLTSKNFIAATSTNATRTARPDVFEVDCAW